MLEILYRIYQVADKETADANREKNWGFGWSISQTQNIEVAMDCMICESREQFKESMRDMYGKDLAFRNTKKLKPGDLYCIVIGEHAYNAEKYFNKVTFTCACCGGTVETYLVKHIGFSDWEIKHEFYGEEKYKEKRFCSEHCKQKYKESEKKKIRPDEDKEFFITRDMFSEKIAGYVYLITKKSTGEFYVGQTVYAPIFRWGQHLKTDRFPIKDITDYKFEVLEIVPQGENILEREKFYIQKMYKENPIKSLNVAQTQNIENEEIKNQISFLDLEESEGIND